MRNPSQLPNKYPTTQTAKYPPIPNKQSLSNLNIQTMPNFGNFNSPSYKPISPIRGNKIGDSAITNVFDEYARSTTSIAANQMHYSEQPNTKPFHNIQTDMFDNDPEEQGDWKSKYQLLYKSYEMANKKIQSKSREEYKMQQTITSQAKTIQKLSEEIFQLNNRLTSSQTHRNQKWNNSFNNHHFNDENSYGNGNQANRFYVEELERSIDGLQRENRRLSQTLMRKVKNSFDY